jgi:hypothetical protein
MTFTTCEDLVKTPESFEDSRKKTVLVNRNIVLFQHFCWRLLRKLPLQSLESVLSLSPPTKSLFWKLILKLHLLVLKSTPRNIHDSCQRQQLMGISSETVKLLWPGWSKNFALVTHFTPFFFFFLEPFVKSLHLGPECLVLTWFFLGLIATGKNLVIYTKREIMSF